MSRLVVLRRPGILVVQGTVVDIRYNTVTIENDVELPVSGCLDKRMARLVFENERCFADLALQPGSKVVASTRDNFLLEMLEEGGETDDKEYVLSAYLIRYSGSFDFKEHNDIPEQHVFAGNVLDAVSGVRKSSGRPWTCLTVGWNRKGVPETRMVLCDAEYDCKEMLKKNICVVTGPMKVDPKNNQMFFNATSVLVG